MANEIVPVTKIAVLLNLPKGGGKLPPTFDTDRRPRDEELAKGYGQFVNTLS